MERSPDSDVIACTLARSASKPSYETTKSINRVGHGWWTRLSIIQIVRE